MVVVVVQLTPVGIKIIASPPHVFDCGAISPVESVHTTCNVVCFSIYLVTAVHIVCAARSM